MNLTYSLRSAGTAAAGAALLLLAAALPAQKLDFRKDFLVVSEKNAGKLSKILDRTGRNGFRVVTGSLTGGDKIVLLLQKHGDGRTVFQYAVVESNKTSEAEQQLADAAEKGFRLLPNTVTAKDRTIKSRQIVMVLEKVADQETAYEYLLLETSLESSLQTLLKGSIDQGYSVVGMMTKKKQTLVILERPRSL